MDRVRSLYQGHSFPLFQNRVYASAASARDCPRGDIELVEDLETGFVYNRAFRPELMEYDELYNNEQANSPAFRDHLKAVSEMIARTIGRRSIVEIGCGKGRFLEMLLANGFDVTGFDPAYEGTNPRIVRRPFSPGSAIRSEGLVLRHVLEHIKNPTEFLLQLREANGGHGKIYIEVPCFDWICAHRAWYDIFYEHVNYFRLADFVRLFGHIYEMRRSFGEQYLCVAAELGSLRSSVYDPAESVKFPEDFHNSFVPSHLQRSAIWGAGSKGVIFAMMMERLGALPEFVIDINPAKQGRFLPVTGLKVLSPSEAFKRLDDQSTVYIMNSNYTNEIREMSSARYQYVPVDETVCS